MHEQIVAGWREWLALPELGIERIKAKLDTGARSSALHVSMLERYQHQGAPWVRFRVHPLRNDTTPDLACQAPVVAERWVSDSGGHRECRIVIRTMLSVGAASWPIELTLTNRETMRFRMLLGRTAMVRRLLVDPASSFMLGRMTR